MPPVRAPRRGRSAPLCRSRRRQVFAGYKTVLRGGRVVFREYHQVGKGRMTNLAEIAAFFAKVSQGAACQLMSRDLYRLCKSLPLDRQLSLLHGGFGFYVVNCLTMHLVYATAFLLALLNVSGLLPYFQTDSAVVYTNITLWIPLFVAVALLLPDAILVWHERGVRLGLHYFYGKVITLAPLYYLFVAQTRAYHFANTMRWGGATYYVTRRAVSISHASLHEIFMAYARSHFYPAIELLLLLVVATSFDAPADMYNATWMLWLLGVALLYVPFLYNPNSLLLPSICADLRQWRAWVFEGDASVGASTNSAARSWRAWWEAGTPAASQYDTATMLGQVLMAAVYAYLAGGVLLYANTRRDGGLPGAFGAHSLWQLSLGAAAVVPAMALALFDAVAAGNGLARRIRPALVVGLAGGGLAWFVAVTQAIDLVSPQEEHAAGWAGRAAPTFYAVPIFFTHAMALSFALAALGAVLTLLQAHVRGAREVLCWVHRTRDYLLSGVIVLPLLLLAACGVFHWLQTKLIFQSSGFFFSDTPQGRRWCRVSSCGFLTLMLAWALYELAWFLGYVSAPPFGWFDC